MKTTSQAQQPPNGATAPAATEEVKNLRVAVTNILGLADDALDQIDAIAMQTILNLGNPDFYRHPETLGNALKAIREKTASASNCIDWEAEQVGCSNPHDDESRWREASRIACERAVDMN
jgi:hypothetical protein